MNPLSLTADVADTELITEEQDLQVLKTISRPGGGKCQSSPSVQARGPLLREINFGTREVA